MNGTKEKFEIEIFFLSNFEQVSTRFFFLPEWFQWTLVILLLLFLDSEFQLILIAIKLKNISFSFFFVCLFRVWMLRKYFAFIKMKWSYRLRVSLTIVNVRLYNISFVQVNRTSFDVRFVIVLVPQGDAATAIVYSDGSHSIDNTFIYSNAAHSRYRMRFIRIFRYRDHKCGLRAGTTSRRPHGRCLARYTIFFNTFVSILEYTMLCAVVLYWRYTIIYVCILALFATM